MDGAAPADDGAARAARGRNVLFFLALLLIVGMMLNDDSQFLDDQAGSEPPARVQDPRVVRAAAGAGLHTLPLPRP